MNIFHKVTLQSMKKSRTRTFVTIIGVILSTAMITAVCTFGISLLTYLANGAKMKYGDWHVAFSDVSSDFVHEQKSNPDVSATATVESIGCSVLDGSQNPNKPYLFIDAFSDQALEHLPLYLLSGRLPENEDEVVISGSITTNGGVTVSIGDTLTLNIGDRFNGGKKLTQSDAYLSCDSNVDKDGIETFVPRIEKIYKVVGICQTPVFVSSDMPGYTVITKTDVQTNRNENLTLFVTLKNPRKIHNYMKKIGKNQTYILNDDVLRFLGLSDNNFFNVLLFSVGGIVILIIMTGSVFLIYNAFNISLNERTQQFGILSSVGATEKQLKDSVLFEGVCIGAIGIPTGIFAGLISIQIVISIVAKNFQNIIYNKVTLNMTISLPVILAAAAISLLTILISAYIPARKAASTPVMECIRQTNEIKIDMRTVKTSKLTQTIYGLEGALALKNFKRNKKRYRSIVMSLVLSVILFISASSFVDCMKQASECVVEFTTFDIGFITQDMEESKMLSLYNKLKYADGVYQSGMQADMKYNCTVNTNDLSDATTILSNDPSCKSLSTETVSESVSLPVQLRFLDDDTYQGIIQDLGLSVEEYSSQNQKAIAVAKMQGRKNRVQEVDEFSDMFRESSLSLTLSPAGNDQVSTPNGKPVSIDFVETVPPDALPVLSKKADKEECTYVFVILLPYSQLNQYETPETPVEAKGLTFCSKDCNKSMHDILEIVAKENIQEKYELFNMHSMFDQNTNIIFIVNVFSYTFIFMISLIAIANVFNTISTNIKLRKRELAMLRSVGMSEHSFQKMMNYECFFFGGRALLAGLPLATICSWLIYKGMYIGGADNIDYRVPWLSICISIFCVLFIVFITMLYSISKLNGENIIDALRDEMA